AAAPVSVTSVISVPEATPVAIDTSSNPASPSNTDAKVEPATKADISTAEPSTGVDNAAGETETRNPTTAGVSAKPSLPVAAKVASPVPSPALISSPALPVPVSTPATASSFSPFATRVASSNMPLSAPVMKSLLDVQSMEREDGEATEDDYDDEDGEIRDA
ncbi:hypothetical protein LPJ66_008306, partial [Kickxella alabastrina]